MIQENQGGLKALEPFPSPSLSGGRLFWPWQREAEVIVVASAVASAEAAPVATVAGATDAAAGAVAAARRRRSGFPSPSSAGW